MTTITQVLVVPTSGAYYYEDLAALQRTPMPVHDRYAAAAITPGFLAIRQVAEAVSVGLLLDSGELVWGDCVAVAYSGKAGREPVFAAAAAQEAIQTHLVPWLQDKRITTFREMTDEIEQLRQPVTFTRPIPKEPEEPLIQKGMSRRQLLTAPARLLRSVQAEIEAEREPAAETVTEQQPFHTAIRYGVSQALLAAVARHQGLTMTELVCREWNLPIPDSPVPIHAQAGGDRTNGADKMIVRHIASLPHALVDDIPAQLGADGSELVRYVRWLAGRIKQLGGPGYSPTIHLDVHGALGAIFDNQPGRILGQLLSLQQAALPYALRIECPVIMNSRTEQIKLMKTLRDYVRTRRIPVQLVADEWANTLDDIQAFIAAHAADMIQIKMPDLGSIHHTIEAVLACRQAGVGAFLGGSCAETHLSAQVSVHLALATRPDLFMAKPGMGVDEAISWVSNEMARTLAGIQARRPISAEHS